MLTIWVTSVLWGIGVEPYATPTQLKLLSTRAVFTLITTLFNVSKTFIKLKQGIDGF